MDRKRAFITGINGQDGSYMAEYLLERDYDVYGLVRRQSNERFDNITHILDKITLIHGDLTDQGSLLEALNIAKPEIVINLAAQSFVKASWDQPELTANITAIGVLRVLEAIRKYNKKIKFIQASSSEQWGNVLEIPQSEDTKFNPQSPYGASKVFGYYITRIYRFSYNMFACNAISCNHESPRRGQEFVTRKISMGVAKIKLGLSDKIMLGNLDAKRDWSHAKDIINGMYSILQHDKPDDFVLCSGETHSVREFLTKAFETIGINDWTPYVLIDPHFMRPAEVNLLQGNYKKANTVLGWKPTIPFNRLICEMVENDIKLLQNKCVAP
jgi:GDPmannose 4,6-dehydratase